MLSVPLVGSWASSPVFGGEFPGLDFIPRLYTVRSGADGSDLVRQTNRPAAPPCGDDWELPVAPIARGSSLASRPPALCVQIHLESVSGVVLDFYRPTELSGVVAKHP